MAKVASDLAETLERSDQFAPRTGLTTERYGRRIVALSIDRSILKPRTIRIGHEFDCNVDALVHFSLGPYKIFALRSLPIK